MLVNIHLALTVLVIGTALSVPNPPRYSSKRRPLTVSTGGSSTTGSSRPTPQDQQPGRDPPQQPNFYVPSTHHTPDSLTVGSRVFMAPIKNSNGGRSIRSNGKRFPHPHIVAGFPSPGFVSLYSQTHNPRGQPSISIGRDHTGRDDLVMLRSVNAPVGEVRKAIDNKRYPVLPQTTMDMINKAAETDQAITGGHYQAESQHDKASGAHQDAKNAWIKLARLSTNKIEKKNAWDKVAEHKNTIDDHRTKRDEHRKEAHTQEGVPDPEQLPLIEASSTAARESAEAAKSSHRDAEQLSVRYPTSGSRRNY